ncbi:hypothetical protein LTR17_017240 [Elasticomyces elasticus]|nr:hypothetical protein LTR17_017240 [Elasticomyces elasticus]
MLDPVEHLYKIIHLMRDGHIRDGGSVLPEDKDWFAISLSPAQFDALKDKLEATGEYSAEGDDYAGVKDYYDDKVRWDYDPLNKGGEYVIRQPSVRHTAFVEELKDVLEDSLRPIVDRILTNSDGPTTAVLKPLEKMWFRTRATEKLLLGGDTTIYRSPDIMFTTQARTLPTFIVELSYAHQDSGVLQRLAQDWLGSQLHRVECVVGITIDGDQGATISVWRRGEKTKEDGQKYWVVRCDMDGVRFRWSSGEPCEGELELSLADFVPDALWARQCNTRLFDESMRRVVVTFADLAEALTLAEAEDERVRNWNGSG